MTTSRSAKAQAARTKKKKALLRRLTTLVLFAVCAGILWMGAAWMMDRFMSAERAQPVSTSPHDDEATSGTDSVAEQEETGEATGENDSPDGTPDHTTQDEPGMDIADSGQTVSLAFVGDVLLGSTVARLLEDHGYAYPYQHIKEQLLTPDVTLANLETPITDRGEPADKQYAYRSAPQVLPAFKEAGFDVVNLANNHILDYGEVGLLDTLQHLDDAGISYVGAGKNGQDAHTPIYLEHNGIRIAVLGYSHVVPTVDWKARDMSEREPTGHAGVASTYDYTRPVQSIERASERADLVIVLAHWGEEREELPEDAQVDLAHRYIDAGADLVVGSHPHVLQSMESYKGKWIAYSLGNFIFTTNDNPKTWDSIILEATCTQAGECELRVTPVLTKAAQPVVMEAAAADKLLERLGELSEGVQVSPDGRLEAK